MARPSPPTTSSCSSFVSASSPRWRRSATTWGAISSRNGAMTVSADSAAVAPRSQQRLPDFFIVGHHKSGTTALYEMLRGHPEIFMPALKEPRFFAEDLRAQFEPEPTG